MNAETMQTTREVGIGVITAVGGTSLYLTIAQTYVGMFGVLAGGFASIVFAIKAIKEWKSQKLIDEDIKYRRENNLPCLRCTDKEG